VRPAEHLLALMVREHFPTAMKLLFAHTPFMILIIPKGYYRYMLSRVLPLAAALVAPLALLAWNLRSSLSSLLFRSNNGGLASSIEQQLGLPVLSYFLGRLVAYLQLQEPSDLDAPARALLARHPHFRLVTFGHTHNPDRFAVGGRRYCNTGTWIPVWRSPRRKFATTEPTPLSRSTAEQTLGRSACSDGTASVASSICSDYCSGST